MKDNEFEWLTVYQVRDILNKQSIIVPMGKDGYNEIIKNGFAFDEDKLMWREVRGNKN